MKAKATLLTSILILGLGVAAQSEGRPVARVAAVTGGTTVAEGLGKARPVAVKDRLGEGLAIQVADHQSVDLLFYGDGHRESLTGPCVAKLEPKGCRMISGNRKSLARIVNGQRVLLLAQGGNLQSVGGSQAGIGDAAVSRPARPAAPLPVAPASAPQPQKSNQGGPSAEGGSSAPRANIASATSGKTAMAPAPPPMRRRAPAAISHGGLRYTQVQGKPSVAVDENETRSFVLTGNGIRREVAARGGHLILPTALKARVGESFSISASRNGSHEQTLPFRILTASEAAEVGALLQEHDTRALLAIERLDELGLPSEAAAKAEELLQQHNDQDVGLLTYSYHLYKSKLADPARARAILQRAQAHGIQLKS